MTGPSVGPVLSACPFAHCAARPMLVVEQAVPGDDETTITRIPQHPIEGDASRFGQCPASLMVIPLDDYSRDQLRTQADAMRLMLPAGNPEDPRTDNDPPRPRPYADPKHELTRRGYADPPKRPTAGPNVSRDGHLGQTVVPLPDEPHAGPGPGRASKPHQPGADDIVEVVPRPKLKIVGPQDQPQQGSPTDMTDNLRDQLIALANLAIEGFGQQQENCAALTASLDDTFTAIRAALVEKQQATHSLALAAVGSRSDIPEPAADMIGASSSIADALLELERAESLARSWVVEAHARAGSAAQSAREYLAVI